MSGFSRQGGSFFQPVSRLRRFFQPVAELLFPSRCPACSRPIENTDEDILCRSCMEELRPIRSPRCPGCGVPFPAGRDHLCSSCLKQEYFFDKAVSAYYYKGAVAAMLGRLKYNGKLSGLDCMARLIRASGALEDLRQPDYILPVPLHPRRLRQRGFNQSLLLARVVFPEHTGRIQPRLVERTRWTTPQIGLGGRKRRTNLQGAFSIRPGGDSIEGSTLLLIDDVLTTGATVNECARVLKAAGAVHVEVFTVARSY